MTDKLAEKLWEKYAIDEMVDRDDFLAAIREYGQAVRKRDAEICREIGDTIESERPNKYLGDSALFCADAIESEPLP